MPWKACHVMDERLRFVARLLDGEKMAPLCAEFGISRKTGYKISHRYKGCGIEGLTDRIRAAIRLGIQERAIETQKGKGGKVLHFRARPAGVRECAEVRGDARRACGAR